MEKKEPALILIIQQLYIGNFWYWYSQVSSWSLDSIAMSTPIILELSLAIDKQLWKHIRN